MKKSKYILQIDRSIKEGQLSLVKGGYMEEFENEAAKMFGNKYGVSTCNENRHYICRCSVYH
ncbi:hypothetical protein COT76_00170 [Candidatus Berkelbacteria bacterium CG10_big_fil_rev_8_21_14_0_10_33_10]|nr:MAG: hypothetical protein COT76_00170 [Candidatus Berkelbacteria bacterium CG10_big_fil_rev_8_21_14_0_10_33_10]